MGDMLKVASFVRGLEVGDSTPFICMELVFSPTHAMPFRLLKLHSKLQPAENTDLGCSRSGS
jgi:hypothetical protein